VKRIGFSTGAIAKGDFQSALARLQLFKVSVVELSALRLEELDSLIDSLPGLNLGSFDFVSLHAPSRFSVAYERHVLDRLRAVVDQGIPVVVHPDVISTPRDWEALGPMLLIENMDKRKSVGRTARDLALLFSQFPDAGLCFDIGHARQVDPTMTEAQLILETFSGRLREVHVSEVNTSSRHDPLSFYAICAFRSVAAFIPDSVPIVLETLIDQGQSDILTEIDKARKALTPACLWAAG
jgi:hypothetical protein